MVYFLVFYFFTCLLGQSLMDLAAMVVVLVALALALRRPTLRRVFFRPFGFEKATVFWMAAVILGLAVQLRPDVPFFTKVLEFRWIGLIYFLYGFLVLVFPTSSWNQSRLLNWLPIVLLGFVSLISIYTISIFFLGFDPLQPAGIVTPMAGGIRSGGTFRNPMTMAHALGLIWSFLFGLVVSKVPLKSVSGPNSLGPGVFEIGGFGSLGTQWLRFLHDNLWSLVTLALVTLAILLTFTRGIWLAIAVSFALGTWMVSRRLFLILSLVGICVLVAMLAAWPGFRERVSSRPGDPGNYDSERVYLWQTNLRIWREHPLLGLGYGENARRLPEIYAEQGAPPNQMTGHAHNQLLHWLAGTGVLGTFGALWFFGFFFVRAIEVWQRRNKSLNSTSDVGAPSAVALGGLLSLVAFFVGGLTESNFEHSKIRYALALILALILWSKKTNDLEGLTAINN